MKPTIRIKGYYENWDEATVGNISSSISGGTPSVSVASYYGGRIPFIRSGEIGADKTQLYITEEGLNSSSAKLVEKGTLLYALYGATSGEVSISKITGAINQAVLAIYPQEGYSSSFLSHYLRAKKETIVGSLLQGGQGNLSGALVKSIIVHTPNSIEEQHAIANYLDSIDSLLQLTAKKIETLKQVKDASLQSMFPQEGETTPRVRFKGFEGEWEDISLGEETYPAGIKNHDNLPLESFSISNEYGFIPQNVQFENGGTMATADKRMYYIVSKNSFGYNPARINVGSLGYYTGEDDAIVSSLYEIFKTSDRICDTFLLYWFKTSTFQKLIEQYQEGGVRFYFFYDKLCMCHTLVPSLEEQQKIADYFTNLDSHITLQTQRLEKLKQIKSACLDNMFV